MGKITKKICYSQKRTMESNRIKRTFAKNLLRISNMKFSPFYNILSAVICLLGSISCTSDTEEPFVNPENGPTGIPYHSLTIQELMPSDEIRVVLTQTFECTAGRLSNYIGKQTYESYDFELINQSTILYKDNQAIVTNANQAISTYTLNPYGYATQCIRQEVGGEERIYTFDYITDAGNRHYLKEIKEVLSNGQTYSQIVIERDNDYSISAISQQIDTYKQQFQCINSKEIETVNTSQIPHPFLVEIHPLSMHLEALYGKLLGEPCPTMKQQILPEGTAENVTYDFSSNTEGWFTSCQITTNREGKKYIRKISYSFID